MDSVPGIFLAVPYGALADKYGRGWILTLGLVGADCAMLFVGKHRLLPAAPQDDLILFSIYGYWWMPCSSGRNYFHDGV